MNTSLFIIELIKAIAWPIASIIILLILKKPISEMILLIKKLKYKGVEIDFDKKVGKLKEAARRQLPEIHADENRIKRKKFLLDLASISSRASVLESWIELESVSIDALKRKRNEQKSISNLSPIRLGEELEKYGILDSNKSEIFNQLRNLRNAAVHATEINITPIIAEDYIDLANSLTSYIEAEVK